MTERTIAERLKLFRTYMQNHGMEAFIVPSADPHGSEYTPAHWECRKWISGFTGSAGTAVITLTGAALWTDSRYFLAAAEQLEGTGFTLMKQRVAGTPSVAEWLTMELNKGDTVGIDGHVFPVEEAESLHGELAKYGVSLVTGPDPFDEIWQDRPAIPLYPIVRQPLEYAGETVEGKVERLRAKLHDLGCDAMLVSALDDVAWLLNLRGSDVECTPVFVAYCLVLEDEVRLYVNEVKTTVVAAYLKEQHIRALPYEQVEDDVKRLKDVRLLLPPETNASMAEAAKSSVILVHPSPVASMKAIKNETEITGFHNAMLRDGIALVKFLRWLRPAVEAGGQTEISIDRKLTSLRAEQPLFKGLSFPTIAGYKDHGAIVHYEAVPETDRELKPEGLLLIDSGAQYWDGTTDITRTIALSEPTAEEKHIYTLVLKGHIALSRLRFTAGASGTQLDLAARRAMWAEGYNFGHGTGHGVGSYLSVHEGPHQIRMNYMPAPIVAGMTVTDEPGLYLTGKFGVRTENVLLAVPYKETEFGWFLTFEPLTLCPIDRCPIELSLLDETEVAWLNDYHKTVKDKLLPLLTDKEDKEWLVKATTPIQL